MKISALKEFYSFFEKYIADQGNASRERKKEVRKQCPRT